MEWQEIALIVAMILLLIAGGVIKKLVKALRELIICIDEALLDDEIDSSEWHDIIQKGKGVLSVVSDIVKLIALKRGS